MYEYFKKMNDYIDLFLFFLLHNGTYYCLLVRNCDVIISIEFFHVLYLSIRKWRGVNIIPH